MPRSEPEPAARPLLRRRTDAAAGAAGLGGDDVAGHHADIARIGGLRLILGEFVQIDLVAQRREIIEVRQQAALRRLDARIHRHRRASGPC